METQTSADVGTQIEPTIKEIQTKERIKELKKKKKTLLTKMRKTSKILAQVRHEKKKVGDELSMLLDKTYPRRERGHVTNLFADLSPEDAAKAVNVQVESVTTADIYPKELENEFNRIDRHSRTRKDDEIEIENDSVEDGVMDFSDQ